MRRLLHEIGDILKETGVEWLEDGIPARGAALSYYVLLSLGPLLILIVGAMELFLSPQEVRDGVVGALRDNVGIRAAETVSVVLEQVQMPELITPGSIATLALLLFGASAAFTNVRGALNTIWGVGPEQPSKREIVIGVVRSRLRGFLMVVLTGLVVTVSFVLTSLVGVFGNVVENGLPFGATLVRGVDALTSLLITGVLFGLMYRTLPAVRVRWSHVWVGAFGTAFIFVLGKSGVAWLISSSSWTSYYGPGASVVAFLAWVYFSSQLFFLGAEFTQVWARRRGGFGEEPATADG